MANPIHEGDAVLTLPNGQIARLPVLKGSEGPSVVDIRTLFSQVGVFTLDPGFTTTSSCVSSITYIDGEQGELWYRGYRIQDLAHNCTYLEVCYLLIYGELPCPAELTVFEGAINDEMCIHEKLLSFYSSFQSDAHPMAIMVGVVGALSAFMHEDINILVASQRESVAIKLVAKFPMIAAVAYRTAYGLPVVYPKKQLGYVGNFLYMMFADPMSDEFDISPSTLDALEKIFILHADHEQNASTSTVRIAGSSMANPFACIAAGIASLWGPMHGGANEAVLKMLDAIGSTENIEQFIAKAKDPKDPFRIMGFGHRVYKNRDPRCEIMGAMAHQVLAEIDAERLGVFELAKELERRVLEDEYFIKRKLYPNVDFYSGVVLEAIGVPRDMFTVIFALARCVGWISQWNEMMSEEVKKIGRPRQLYMGYSSRQVGPIEEREEQQRIARELISQRKRVWSPLKNR